MPIVKVTAPATDGLIRQTPNSQGIWGKYTFTFDPNIKDCDYWVVFGNFNKEETICCAKSNTIFVNGEPPTVLKYDNNFLQQFSTIVSCSKHNHPHVISSFPPLPWRVGRNRTNNEIFFTKNYDEFKSQTQPNKTKLVSIITSDKTWTAGHKRRYEFAKKLKKYFGDSIDVFGDGVNSIDDKWDAIAPYKYHIAIENCSQHDYWTEKLADTFLCGAYPIYSGCPNISDYFSRNSLATIDINNFEESIAVISDILNSDLYEKNISTLTMCRNKILDEYNFFPFIVNIIEQNLMNFKDEQPKELITIYPESHFTKSLPKRLNNLTFKCWRLLKSKLYWLF